MRVSRVLRNRIAQKRVVASLAALIPQHEPADDQPATFHATSGDSRTELAAQGWMPHDYRPIVGFTPNP